MKIISCLFVLAWMFAASPAWAQCAMPSGPAAEAGVILFNDDHKVMQYCNGDKWIGLWGGRGGGGLPDCANGEIAQFSGGAWRCNNGSGLDHLNASNLKSGTVPPARMGTGTANNATFLRGDGTWASVLAAPPVCSGEDKALQWSGTAWLCATIEGGGGAPSFDLVNGMHSSEQCTNVGGTVITSGANKFCRFTAGACPAGWIRYQSWGTYVANTCSLGGCPPCTASAKAWSNSAPSTCAYWAGGRYCDEALLCTASTTQVGCY